MLLRFFAFWLCDSCPGADELNAILFECRLKIFVPIAFLAFTILVPVNWTNSTLKHSNLTYSDLDKLSISNIPMGSTRYPWLSDKLFSVVILFLHKHSKLWNVFINFSITSVHVCDCFPFPVLDNFAALTLLKIEFTLLHLLEIFPSSSTFQLP